MYRIAGRAPRGRAARLRPVPAEPGQGHEPSVARPGGDRRRLRRRDAAGRSSRSAPIAAMPTRWRAACRSSKVLGELMQRDNGLMRGKGGSMHLTSVEHGVMGSYAIIGAHLPIACGAAWRAQYKGAERRLGLLLRRRHHQYRRLPRGAEFRRGLEAAGDLRLREQPLHGIHADRRRDGGRASGRRPRRGLRARAHRHRRQRRRRRLSHRARRL